MATKKIVHKLVPLDPYRHVPFIILGAVGFCLWIALAVTISNLRDAVTEVRTEAHAARFSADTANSQMDTFKADLNIFNVCPAQLNDRLRAIEKAVGVKPRSPYVFIAE